MFTKRVALVVIAGCLLTGCRSDRIQTYPAQGSVLFDDGQPVKNGTIELESLEFKTTASGQIREDGTFVLGTYTPNDGAASGKHRVIIVQLIVSDGVTKHQKDHGRAVPTQYSRYETSGLTVEIQPQKQNSLTLKLQSKRT